MPEPRSAGRDRSARSPSRGPGLLPLLAIFAIAAVAVVAGRMIAAERESEPSEPEASPQERDPFSSWRGGEPGAPGTLAPAREGGAGSGVDRDSDLWQDPTWQEALGIAERARGLADEALQAHRSGDASAYQQKGKQAKEAFDEAFTMTAELEERLLATYPESDPGVRAIVRERTEWSDKMRVLHKTTGR